MKKRLLSLVMALTMICGFAAFLPELDLKASAAKLSAQQIVDRANYMYNLVWTSQKTFKGYKTSGGYQYYFNAGQQYHIPYGMLPKAIIGYGISPESFISEANNGSSVFYNENSRGGYNNTSCPHYALDCSAFVSYCWGLSSVKTTSGLPGVSSKNLGFCSSSTVNSIQIGDALNCDNYNSCGDYHVILVTATNYNNGVLQSIEVIEETPPQMKKSTLTRNDLINGRYRNYKILRYADSYVDPNPPTTSVLQLDKSSYGIKDTINMSFSSDTSIKMYTLQIWKGDILVKNIKTSSNSYSLKASDLGDGDFGAYVTCENEVGFYTSDVVSFRIAKELSNPQISINKTEFDLNETLSISASADGGVDLYSVQIWKGSQIVYQKDFTGHSISINCASLGIGDYGAYVSCTNASGTVTSKTVSFRIGHALSSPQMSIDKESVELGDSITVTVSADGGVDYYSIQIWKGNSVVYQKEFKGHSISVNSNDLGSGEYAAVVTCVNQLGTINTPSKNFTIYQGHMFGNWTTTKAATCTTDGEKSRTCSVCGKKETGIIAKLGHSWNVPTYTWSSDYKTCTAKRVCKNDSSHVETQTVNSTSVVKTNPTCTTKGTTTYTAFFTNSAFAKQTKDVQDIAATGHNWGTPTYTWSADGKSCTAKRVCKNDSSHVETENATITSKVKIAATCTVKGITTYTATFKNTAFKTQTKDVQDIAVTNHNWSVWHTTKEATCTAEGSQERTCSVCGKTETGTIAKLGHDYKATVVKPTCTAKGYTLHKCSRCGDSYKDTYKDAAGHSWSKWTTTKKATCTADGSKTRTCSVCKKTETATIAKLGHDYVTTVVKPTCTAKGYTLHKCSRCGDSYKDTYKDATGHKWSKWTTTKKATCTADGSKTRTCSVCKKTETATIAKLGHDYVTTVVAPTCTAKGYTLHKCSRCGDSYKDTYKDATGHSWSKWKTTGFEFKNNTSSQMRKCSVCGKTEKQTTKNAINRLAGSNRYETAAKLSSTMYKKSDTIVLATGLTFNDALVAVPLASAYNAPLLLGTERHITAQTEAELKRLKAKNVIVVSTNGAIGAKAKAELKALKLNVTYIEGKTCFETASKVAKALQKKAGKAPDTIFFATDGAFADALSASPVAAIKNAPIIYLKKTGSIDTATANYLESVKGKIKNAYIIGGSGAISDEMMKNAASALGLTVNKTVQRLWGANRYETCVAVNNKFKSVLSSDGICVAKGLDFPDALAGGVYAAATKQALFLADGKKLQDFQNTYLKGKNAAKITVFGGTNAVPDSLVKLIAKASV